MAIALGDELYRGLKVGKYELLTQLSAGGMAELFLAFTRGPGGFRKYVVVKRILPDAKDNDHFVNMFLDEARITAAFTHPNIAQVFDLDSDGEGPYLAMEFIAGQNLNQVTSACAKKRAVLPIGFSVAVNHDLALALHYAHTFKDPAGKSFPVIHRDVAQKNIMVTYDGVVKLLDFGIAKARGSLGRTSAGMVKGTTGYMAPEQVRGEPLDGQADVFSLGVVLWEMVTGKRLFAGENELEEMRLILSAPIPRPSQVIDVVPEALSDIIMRALAREKSDRFPTAKDFAKAIDLSVPELMFDVDQRAAFMQELFAEKVRATQALMESAGGELEKAAVLDAVKLIREDDGRAFPAPKHSPPNPNAPKKKRPPPRPRPAQEEAQLTAMKIQQEAEIAKLIGADVQKATPISVKPPTMDGAPAPTDERESQKFSNWPLIIVVFLIAMGGFITYKVVFNPDAQPAEPPPDVAGPAVPVPMPASAVTPVQPAPTSPISTLSAASKASATPAPTPTAPVKTGRAAAKGTFTLVMFPSAKVYLGKDLLGQAPFFNLPVPEGEHLLSVVGDDGKKHSLSVKITANRNTKLKLNLNDLP